VDSVEFPDIVAARNRVGSGVIVTPCQESPELSALCGATVFTKREYLQRTGSFKERGARNAMLLLSGQDRESGVVAASAGNHALALAYHGRDLGIPVTVVMPEFAPLVKQERCRRYGARVVLYGSNIGEAKVEADRLSEAEGLCYVHGFDDPAVIAGAGTVGLEVLEQVPDADVIVVPVGGAGLIAGLGLAAKTLRPDVRIIGVEPARATSFSRALAAGGAVPTDVSPTLGDGLAVPTVGPRAFELARKVVDRSVAVEESDIALAILRLLEIEKGVVEGAGAAPLAALLEGQVPEALGRRVVLILAGGNIDPGVLGRVIEYGLVTDGRLSRFRAVISDRPGGLATLTQAIASTGASVAQITHERAFAEPDVSKVEVRCVVETRDRAHLDRLLALLSSEGIQILEN
jgi:threonine dehydratase